MTPKMFKAARLKLRISQAGMAALLLKSDKFQGAISKREAGVIEISYAEDRAITHMLISGDPDRVWGLAKIQEKYPIGKVGWPKGRDRRPRRLTMFQVRVLNEIAKADVTVEDLAENPHVRGIYGAKPKGVIKRACELLRRRKHVLVMPDGRYTITNGGHQALIEEHRYSIEHGKGLAGALWPEESAVQPAQV